MASHGVYVVGDIDSQLKAPVHSGHKTMPTTIEHWDIVRDDSLLGREPIVKGARLDLRSD